MLAAVVDALAVFVVLATLAAALFADVVVAVLLVAESDAAVVAIPAANATAVTTLATAVPTRERCAARRRRGGLGVRLISMSDMVDDGRKTAPSTL